MADIVLNKNAEIDNNSTEIFVTTKTKKFSAKFFLALIVILLFSLILIIGVMYFFILPQTSPAKIQFQGNAALSELFLKQQAGIESGIKWHSFNTTAAAGKIAKISAVEAVTVQKKLPDKILITITERTPVAVTFINVNDQSFPFLIDKNGVLFRSDDFNIADFPIISGFNFTEYTDGMRLNALLITLLEQLQVLESENKKLLSQVSEIKITAKKYGGYDLIIFPAYSSLQVKIGNELNSDVLKHVMLVLDVVQGLDNIKKINGIDLRSGVAVIDEKGSQNNTIVIDDISDTVSDEIIGGGIVDE